MKSDQKIILEEKNNVGYITLNKPPANAYELDFWQKLDSAVDAAIDSDTIRIIVLRSSSEKFFCAGADIRIFAENKSQDNLEMAEAARYTTNKLADTSKISIAAVNGHALGGGLELTLACDFRFAAEGEYYLGLPEVALGLMPGNGGVQRLTKLVGYNKALLLLLTGDRIKPAEAFDAGLVDKIFPADQLEAEATEFAERLAFGAFRAAAAIKKTAREGLTLKLNEALEIERKRASELFDSTDAREGFSAFLEKRKPVFREM